jgi:hypothetical protein
MDRSISPEDTTTERINQANISPPLSQASLSPEELQDILDRIKANLHRHPVFSPEVTSKALDDVERCLQYLRSSKAPLYVEAYGRGPVAIVARILNLPIRLFGRRQLQFNEVLREFLADASVLFHILYEQSAEIARLSDEVQELRRAVQELQAD